MTNIKSALQEKTIVNKEKTNCINACFFLQVRYNISTLNE